MSKIDLKKQIQNNFEQQDYTGIDDLEFTGKTERPAGLEKLPGTFMIPLAKIRVSPERLRTNPEQEDDIQPLSDSIIKQGLIQPLTVKKEKDTDSYVIITGERRYWASKKAGLEKIPCIIKNTDQSEEQTFVQMLTENQLRKDLSDLEKAKAYETLIIKFGHTQAQIAREFGEQASHVSEILKLIGIPDDLKEKISDNKIFTTEKKIEIAKQKTPEAMKELAEEIQTKNLSVPETRKASKQKRNIKTKKQNPLPKILKKCEEFKKATELLEPATLTKKDWMAMIEILKPGIHNFKKAMKENAIYLSKKERL